jgi:hypothetical protein
MVARLPALRAGSALPQENIFWYSTVGGRVNPRAMVRQKGLRKLKKKKKKKKKKLK